MTKKIWLSVIITIVLCSAVMLLASMKNGQQNIAVDVDIRFQKGSPSPLNSICDNFQALHGFYPKTITYQLNLLDDAAVLDGVKIFDKDSILRSETKKKIMVATINTYQLYSNDTLDKKQKCRWYFEHSKRYTDVDVKPLRKEFVILKTGELPPLPEPNPFIFDGDFLLENNNNKKYKETETEQAEIKEKMINFFKNHEAYIGYIADIVRVVKQRNNGTMVSMLPLYYKSHPNPQMRLWAAWAFIRLGLKDKLPLFVEHVGKEENAIVKLLSIRGIAELGGQVEEKYKDYALEKFNDGSDEEKIFAIEALTAINDNAFEKILKAVKCDNPDVRTAAMLALTKLSPDKAMAPLLDALRTEKELDMKYNAWYCLTKCLDPKRKVISLQELKDKEQTIIETLSKRVSEKEKAENR